MQPTTISTKQTTTTSTEQPSTTTAAKQCPPSLTKHDLSSTAADVVFMVDISNDTHACDRDNEGDFIKNLIKDWTLNHMTGTPRTRIGVVVYAAHAYDKIYLNQFNYSTSSFDTISDAITKLFGNCDRENHQHLFAGTVNQGESPDLANAFEYVLNHSFVDARPNIPKVVIPIMHSMPSDKSELNKIIVAAQMLKDSCISINGVAVYSSRHSSTGRLYIDWPTAIQSVSQPYPDHLWTVQNFSQIASPNLGCDHFGFNRYSVGCHAAEVIFMVEYANGDQNSCGLNRQGEFIKKLVDRWHIAHREIRIGVVSYHNTAEKQVSLSEFNHQPGLLKQRIENITGSCHHDAILHPSGIANQTKALDFVRENAFKDARPGVPRVVIPIIHAMSSSSSELQAIVKAAQRLKDTCATISPIVVKGAQMHAHSPQIQTAMKMSTSPYNDFYVALNSYRGLDGLAPHFGGSC